MSDEPQSVTNGSATPETISFDGFRYPPMESGSYTFQAHVAFGVGDIQQDFNAPEVHLLVSGPRFVFSPAEIYAVFPPRDSLGEFDNVLPHIELTPSALPWQRHAGRQSPTDGPRPRTPWLALILLQEDEWTNTDKVEITSQPWEILRSELGLTEEITDRPGDGEKPFPPVKVLRFQREFLEAIFPSGEDLEWLAHVRAAHTSEQTVERAVIVCNRMPSPGARAEVHLVSLEEQLDDQGKLKFAGDRVPLLSLHAWQFSVPLEEQFRVSAKAIGRLAAPLQAAVAEKFPSEEDQAELHRGQAAFAGVLKAKGFEEDVVKQLINLCHVQTETFKGLLDALDVGWLHVPDLERHGEAPFKTGSIPLAQGLRGGGKTVAWYRGPLVPNKGLSAAFQEKLAERLPVRNADQLLLYHPETGMLNASYAAAWALGRMLAVGEPRLSQLISQWKTSHAREVALVEQNLYFSHIPFTESNFAHQSGGQLEGKLQTYFTDLSLLKGVPFQYLVPHETMLPAESLRFFYVDPLWVEALLDGAFSIGRTTEGDQKRERFHASAPHRVVGSVRTGALLRSDLVAGWPSLSVEGFAAVEAGPAEGAHWQSIPPLRLERLGPSVLFVMFEGEVQKLTVHLPPESLHFGFSRVTNHKGEYAKELKSLSTGAEVGKTCTVTWRENAAAQRVIAPASLAASLAGEFGLEIQHAGHLALELLEGAPRLEVSR